MAPGATAFHVNTELMVGMDCLEKGNDPAASLPRDKSCQEVARVKEIKGDVVTFFKPLKTTTRRAISCRRSLCVIGGGWTWIWVRCSGMTTRSARRPGPMAGSA